jgi:MoaA/NifB/PqqE/SkfB family radical SAM enzyme
MNLSYINIKKASLRDFFGKKQIFLINEDIPNIESVLKNERFKKNHIYKFYINPKLKTSFELIDIDNNVPGFLIYIRYILFYKIQNFLKLKGLSLDIYNLRLDLKDRIKKLILSLKPTLKSDEPSLLLKDFVLVQSLKDVAEFKFPKYLHIALTNKCNLKCIMCPYHSKLLKEESHTNPYFDHAIKMPADILRKVIDEASMYGSSLTFGQYDEPMLYKDFIGHVSYAKQKGCKVSLTSNGTYVDEERAKKLLETGIDHISFSIDAASHESYKKIRGGNFDTPINNIKKLVEIRNKYNFPATIRACMVLQEHNMHEKEDFKSLMHQIGIDMISYYNLSVFKDGIWQNEVLNFDVDEKMPERYACSQLWSQAMIYPDGNVSLCCATTMYVSYRKDIPYMGNLNDASISQIWLSKHYNKVRSNALAGKHNSNSICRDCTIWHNFMGKNLRDNEGNLVHINPYETFITFKK